MSILDLAVPASETVESINALIYGSNGAGKTRLAGSGRDKGKNDLIIATERGTVSAARANSEANVLRVNTYEELLEAIEAIEDNPDRFEWVILDSLTKTQDLIWDYLLDPRSGRNPSRSKYKKELQEYGEEQERLKEIVNRLVNCDSNVIFTALTELAVDEEAQEFRRPQIHGKQGEVAEWVCGQVDLLGYLRVATLKGETVRRLDFGKKPEYYAKDRFDVFKGPQINLTLEKMTNELLEAGVNEKEESK